MATPRTEEDRFDRYFQQLSDLIPNPPKDWDKDIKSCKWLKILQERKGKKLRDIEV